MTIRESSKDLKQTTLGVNQPPATTSSSMHTHAGNNAAPAYKPSLTDELMQSFERSDAPETKSLPTSAATASDSYKQSSVSVLDTATRSPDFIAAERSTDDSEGLAPTNDRNRYALCKFGVLVIALAIFLIFFFR